MADSPSSAGIALDTAFTPAPTGTTIQADIIIFMTTDPDGSSFLASATLSTQDTPTQTPHPLPTVAATTTFPSSTPQVTVTASSATSATSSAAAVVPSNSGFSFGAKMAAILVPILVVLALIPILYLFYLNRRHRRERQEAEEPRVPTETRLLDHSSRHNSISVQSPFIDSERTRSSSLGVADRPSSEILRVPSPTLPSPSMPVFRTQEAWPLTAPLPEPPSQYNTRDTALHMSPPASAPRPHNTTLRPPSSNYGGLSPQPRSPNALTQGNISTHDLGLATRNRDSDAVSEMSFDPDADRRRPKRDTDALSFVSALLPEDQSERHSHPLF